MTGTVLKGVGGFYTVLDDAGECYTLRAQSKLRRQRLTPMVGDRVSFTPGQGEQHGWLEGILERKNQLVRPPIANIEALALVVAAGAPEPDLLLVDRMLLYAKENGIEPMLVVNKCDQDRAMAEALRRQYAGAGIGFFAVSAQTGQGVAELKAALRGSIHALGGQSGVGKSSLINAMYGLSLQTGSISEKIERGRNTTRHSELIPLPEGGMVLDTPGFSLLELKLMEPHLLQEGYPEFQNLEPCRFSPCAHISEPDCAVRRAVAEGRIDEGRWARYKVLYEEMNKRWKERYD